MHDTKTERVKVLKTVFFQSFVLWCWQGGNPLSKICTRGLFCVRVNSPMRSCCFEQFLPAQEIL